MANAKVVVQYSGGPQVVDTNFSLGVLATADLKVTVAGYVDGLGELVALAFTYNKTTGRVTITTPIPAPYPATVTVQRVTPIENLFVNFEGGADVTKRNLGNASKQTLMAVQELEDRIEDLEGLSDYVDEVLIEATDAAAEAAASAAIAVTAADALTAVVGGESVEFITDGRTTSYPLAYVPPDPRLMFVFLTGWKLIYEKHFVLVPNALALSGQGLLFLSSVDNPYASPFTGQSVELQYTRPVEGAFVTPDDFSSRAAFEAWVAAGGALGAGRTITAGGLRYMGQPGATELPRLPGAVPVDPTLRHYGAVGDNVADDSAAILAAWVTGRELDHEGLTYAHASPIIATVPRIRWKANGARLRYTGTAAQYSVYLTVGLNAEVVLSGGSLTIDGGASAFTAIRIASSALVGDAFALWPTLDMAGLHATNYRRASLTFSGGDGIFITGGWQSVKLTKPRASNGRMAAGAEVSGSQGIFGITIGSGTLPKPKSIYVEGWSAENIWSEDPTVMFDQDAMRIFQDMDDPTTTCKILNGEVHNVTGRTIKLHSGPNAIVSGVHRVLSSAVVPQSGEYGPPDIDCQQAPASITNLRFDYDGIWHGEFVQVTDRGAYHYGAQVVSDISWNIRNAAGNTISAVRFSGTTDDGPNSIHRGTVSGLAGQGAIAQFCSVHMRGSEENAVALFNAAGEVTATAITISNAGGTPKLIVAAGNIINTGAAVPFCTTTTADWTCDVVNARGFTDVPATTPIKHANGSIAGPGSQLHTIKRTGTGNLINAADKDGARISGLRLDNDRTTLGDVAGHGISASGKDMVFHDLVITDYGSAAAGGGGTGLLVVPGVSGIPERVRVSDVVLTPDLAGVITVGWLLEDAQISLVSRVIAEGVVGGIGYAHELKNDAKYNSLNQLIARASNVALVYGQDGAGVDGADYNVATNIVAAACDTGLFVGEGIGNVTVGMVHDTTGAPDNDTQYGVRFSGGASKNYAGGVATFGAMDQSIYISGDRNYAEVAAHDTAAEVVRFTSGSAANVVQIAHPGARTSIRTAILDESTYALDSTNANIVRSDATGERIGSISGRFWDKLGEAGVTPFSSQPWVYEHDQYAIHALITAGNVGDVSGLVVSTGRDGTNTGLVTYVIGATASDNYWNIASGGAARMRIDNAAVTVLEPLIVDNGTTGGLIASFKGNNPRVEWYDAIGLTTAAISNVDGQMILYPDYTGVGGGQFEVRISGTGSGQRGLVIDSTLKAQLFAQLHAALGTATVPAISTSTDADTGMYFLTADVLGFATGGAQRLRLESAGAVFAVPLLSPNGTAAAPTYSFSSDPDCGMFRSNTNEVSIATGGTTRVRITNSAGTFMTHPGPFANDAAAATGGVAIGETYRVTGGTLAWRQT